MIASSIYLLRLLHISAAAASSICRRETTDADSSVVSPLRRAASIRACRDGDARRIAKPLVQIGAHFRNQRLDPVLEEMVAPGTTACSINSAITLRELNVKYRNG